jgi:hypothetical protein
MLAQYIFNNHKLSFLNPGDDHRRSGFKTFNQVQGQGGAKDSNE